jgi:hypothetical protein
MNTLFYIFLVFFFNSLSFANDDNLLSLADQVINLTEEGIEKKEAPPVKKKIKKNFDTSHRKYKKNGKAKSVKLCRFKKIKKDRMERLTRTSCQRVSHRLF